LAHLHSLRRYGYAGEIIDAVGKLLQLKVRGMFKKADYDRMIQIAKEAVEREGKVRALVILEGFEGWERRGDWGDVSFMMQEGQQIEKNGDRRR
jgi:hypothetical protein